MHVILDIEVVRLKKFLLFFFVVKWDEGCDVQLCGEGGEMVT